MNLQQLFMILKARYKIALFTMILIMGATLALSLIWPSRYTASTSIVVDVSSSNPLGEVTDLSGPAMSTYLPTQVDIIYSDRTAQKAIKMLKLDQNPTVREKWMEDTGGRGRLEPWLAVLLQKDLKAKPSRDSNVISISYSSVDPDFSAAVANAFAQSYIDTNIELKVDPAKQYATWFLDQSKSLRDNLAKAQSRLSEYQQKKGIVITDERLDAETAKLSDLTAQLTAIEAGNADAQSKRRSSRSDTIPEIMQNSVVQNLRADISRQEAKLSEAAGNLGRNHPQYQRMQAEISALKQRLAIETEHLAGGFTTSENVGQDKAESFRRLIAAQKQKLLELRHQRDEANVLLGDVNSAQKAYDAVSQRFTQSNLESKSTQTNISVITPATPPLHPSSPLPVLYTIVAGIVGTLLGIGIAFMMEMLDRRIRTVDDIESSVGLPVLAELSRQQGALKSWWRRVHLLPRPRGLIEFAN